MSPYYRVYSNESTAAEHVETLEQAQARAEELAAKHPGRAFEILRCVGIAQTSKASTLWMDGEGPRYRMLEKGEIIERGDEFDKRREGVWCPHNLLVGRPFASGYYPTRRPL